MSFTYSTHLHIAKPSDGDSDHGDEIRQGLDVMDQIIAPKYTYFVSPDFSSANLFNGSASSRRHFNTIQGAIDAINALGTSSYTDYYKILVYPSAYYENLTFSTSVQIIGVGGKMNSLGMGGARYPSLNGSSSSASSLITVSPPTSQSVAVSFSGFRFENAYSTSNSTELTNPYLLDFKNTGTAGTPQYFGMTDCQARMQTWGDHNLWTYGLKIRGRVISSFTSSDFGAWRYAGGENDGGFRTLFSYEGDMTNSAELYMDSCSVDMSAGFSGGQTASVFCGDDMSIGRCTRSSIYTNAGPLIVYPGTAGTNTFSGLTLSNANAAEWVAWGNINKQTVRL